MAANGDAAMAKRVTHIPAATGVLVHLDQGIQYSCSDWRKFLGDRKLEANLGRRGNCHDNAVAESSLLVIEGGEG